MDTFTITEDKLSQLIFNIKKEATVHTCEIILKIIEDIRQPIEEDFEYSIENYGIKTEKWVELSGKLNGIAEVTEEVISFKTSIEETAHEAN